MLQKDVGKILEATLSTNADARLKVLFHDNDMLFLWICSLFSLSDAIITEHV